MVGRPRTVDDSQILRAAAEVVGRGGPAGLTLAAVAEEVGLAPGTLAQRFGSKHGLLVALAKQAAVDADAVCDRAREQRHGALSALRALAVESMAPMSTPERFANHLAFLCMDIVDEQLRVHAAAVQRAQRRAIETLLAAAASTGELDVAVDVAGLAAAVQSVIAGAGLTWAVDGEGTLAQRLNRELDALLSPHVLARFDALEET